jgi:hypothetical protein
MESPGELKKREEKWLLLLFFGDVLLFNTRDSVPFSGMINPIQIEE